MTLTLKVPQLTSKVNINHLNLTKLLMKVLGKHLKMVVSRGIEVQSSR